jgi:hypothetical protein
MSVAKELAALFRRDLSRLIQQIEAYPNDEMVWHTHPAITNSAGNLVLHLEGNLREYIGRQLGMIPYSRRRELEFSSKGILREELVRRVADLKVSIPSVIEGLSPEQFEVEYRNCFTVRDFDAGVPDSPARTSELAYGRD